MRSIFLYNTLSGRKELFKPLVEGQIGMYVCGVTVYDYCHMGHARAYVAFDVIRRYFEFVGYKVCYIQNFTDIDDKIIDRIGGQEIDVKKVKTFVEPFIQAYFEDMDRLKVKRASSYPCATDYIDQMIIMIQLLLDKGFAYESDGNVFFSVRQMKNYGELSGCNLEQMLSSEQVESVQSKKDLIDFVLWKKAKKGEPFWESPFGMGRPGWHLECSVMSKVYLGETFDIHGGGSDLIFPHHENEKAQSECSCGRPFVNYWLHNGFVTVNEEKMSKSLGNFFTVRDVLKKFSDETLRFFLLSAHYRSPIEYSEAILSQSRSQLERGYDFLETLLVQSLLSQVEEPLDDEVSFLQNLHGEKERFLLALDDDINTPQAIAILFEIIRRVHVFVKAYPLQLTADFFKSVRLFFLDLSHILGLFDQERVLIASVKEEVEREDLYRIEKKLLRDRIDSKQNKQWDKADELRLKLLEMYPDSSLRDIQKETFLFYNP